MFLSILLGIAVTAAVIYLMAGCWRAADWLADRWGVLAGLIPWIIILGTVIGLAFGLGIK